MSDPKFYKNFPPWLYKKLDAEKYNHEIAVVLKISNNQDSEVVQVWEKVISRDVTHNKELRARIMALYSDLVGACKEIAINDFLYDEKPGNQNE